MKSISHTASFDLPVPIDTLFPLFSPEGEKHWVPDWDYVDVNGVHPLREDGVFLTQTHDHGAAATAIWLVKHFDAAAHTVQFYKVEPEQKVGLITVACRALSEHSTQTQVSYAYTALSTQGEAFIASFDAQAYQGFIQEWQDLLTQYFARKVNS